MVKTASTKASTVECLDVTEAVAVAWAALEERVAVVQYS